MGKYIVVVDDDVFDLRTCMRACVHASCMSDSVLSPFHCSVIQGTPANLSGLALNQGSLKLAEYPQLLAAPSRDHGANVSGGPLITRGLGSGGAA